MNLATLSTEEQAAIELHKQVCFARFKCKGLLVNEQKRVINALPENVQAEIARLKKARAGL